MGAFTISGAVRPAVIPRLGVSSLTVRWRERAPHVKTEPPDADLALFWLDCRSEPIYGAIPTSYRPPFLNSHDAALTWLQGPCIPAGRADRRRRQFPVRSVGRRLLGSGQQAQDRVGQVLVIEGAGSIVARYRFHTHAE